MKKSIVFAVAALLLLPIEGSAQKWLKNLEKVAKEVEKVLDSTPSSTDTANSGTTESSSTDNATGEYQKGGLKIVTHHPDLVLKIKRCVASGNTCVIDMIVTNTGDSDLKDVIFYSGYYNYSTAFDDEGNQYGKRALLIRVGNGELAGRTLSYIDALAQLPANVPLKMRIQVEGVPDSATEFMRINLACTCNELSLSRSKPMILSHIPISRDGDE